MIEKICDFCNQRFFVPPFRAQKAHFCSFQCYNNYRAKLAYPKKICPFCKKEFSINRETRYRKYCSQKCANLARRKYEHKDKVCNYCGEKFKYNSKNPHQKFCSVLCQIKSRAYKVDENFFQKIDSQGKAYLLGLIFSDGSLAEKRVNFASNDKKLVELCKKLLKSKAPIYHYQKSFILISGNRNLYNSLRELGVIERKSWKEYGLPPIPESLMWHFLRGVFDGDGSFYIDDRGNGKWRYLCASFSCGSRRFLREIKERLEKQDIKTHNIRFDRKPNNKGSWQLRISKKESVKKFANYLYENSKYFLERKYKIVKTFYA